MVISEEAKLYEKIIRILLEEIPSDEKRQSIHIKIIDAFWVNGWNTQNECIGIDSAYDRACDVLMPDDDL